MDVCIGGHREGESERERVMCIGLIMFSTGCVFINSIWPWHSGSYTLQLFALCEPCWSGVRHWVCEDMDWQEEGWTMRHLWIANCFDIVSLHCYYYVFEQRVMRMVSLHCYYYVFEQRVMRMLSFILKFMISVSYCLILWSSLLSVHV